MDNQILNFIYKKGMKTVSPANEMINHWAFNENEEKEAILANSLANLCNENGMNANDLQHLFPAILRMLKNNSEWSK